MNHLESEIEETAAEDLHEIVSWSELSQRVRSATKELNTVNHLQLAIEETGLTPLAFACVISGNRTEIMRQAFEKEEFEYIIESWDLLLSDPEYSKGLAKLRTTLSKVSKEKVGEGLTVVNSKLVPAITRKTKPKPVNLLLEMAKEFSKEMDQDKQDKIIALMVELSS